MQDLGQRAWAYPSRRRSSPSPRPSPPSNTWNAPPPRPAADPARGELGTCYFAVWALALVVEHTAQIAFGGGLMAAVHQLLLLSVRRGRPALPPGQAAARPYIDAAVECTAETTRLEEALSETVTSAGSAKEARLSGAAPVLDAMAGQRWSRRRPP